MPIRSRTRASGNNASAKSANSFSSTIDCVTTASPISIPARGATSNPTNRFEQIHLERDEDWNPEEDALPTTKFFHDRTQTILNRNDSPDIGFTYSLNAYRGCEHGCIYCYARPFHEYLGFSAGLDFETRIMVKTNAPHLLREELSSPKWQPQCIAMSGVTDCYQPVERKLKLTRHNAVVVFISVTTLDTDLRKVMEPRTSPPAARLATIRKLAEAGVPVG